MQRVVVERAARVGGDALRVAVGAPQRPPAPHPPQKVPRHAGRHQHIPGGNVYFIYLQFEFIPLMPSGAFNICCPRDCVSRHNGGTSGAPFKPL